MKFSYFLVLSSLLVLFSCKTTQSTQTTAKKTEIKADDNTPFTSKEQEITGLYIDACTEMIAGDVKVARELFKQILKLEPKHHASMYNIAKIALEAGADKKEVDEAIAMGEEALKYDSENYWYYVTLVDAYKLKGDFDNAIRLQVVLNQKFPKQRDTYLTLADLYKKTAKYEEALNIFKQIEDKFGTDEIITIERFKLYEDMGNYAEATTMLDRLMKSTPNKTEYYHYKYQLLSKQGKEKEGIEVLKNLLKIQPNDALALVSLADYYKQQDNMQESDKYLFKTFENAETPVKGKLNIIQNLMKDFSDKEVAERVRKLIKIIVKIHPNTPEANELQGDIYDLDNQPDSAWTMYKKSLLTEPRNDKLWLKLLRTSDKSENYMRLLSDAGDALEYYPNNEMILFYYALSNLKLANYEAAISGFEKIKKRSTNPDILILSEMSLAEAKIGANRWEEAQKNYEDLLKKYPQNDMVLNAYAQRLAEKGDNNLPKAKELINKALSIKPNMPAYMQTQAQIFYQEKSYQDAANIIQKAILMGSPSADILLFYGDILYKLGKTNEATASWEKAIKAGAKNVDINKRKKDL